MDQPDEDQHGERLLASTNLESFFSCVFKIKLNRLWWVLIAGVVAYLVMLTNVFSYILKALGWQGVFVMAWVAIALATMLYRTLNEEKFIEEKAEFEFRPGRVRYGSPGLIAWLIAAAVGLYLIEGGGSFGVTWGPPITFVVAFVIQYVALTAFDRHYWVMSRPHNPRDEVEDMWEARVRCHVCERSYIACDIDRDPSAVQEPTTDLCWLCG